MKPPSNLAKGFSPKYVAEGLGTFCLVFAGTGAITVNEITRGTVTTLGISLVFGFVVLAMIYAIGHISGAHMNPAVTIGFFSAGRLPAVEVPRYLAVQIIGAVLASALLRFIFFGQSTHLGVTIPIGPWWQGFLLEFILTFILMFVIMGVTTDHRAEGLMAGVAIGATIAFEAILGGPISGASMNPARSFGPAVVTGLLRSHWIYWIAPIAGSAMGAKVYSLVRCDRPQQNNTAGCC